MIRIDVLDLSPVYLRGLAEVLAGSPVRIVATRSVPGDPVHPLADLFVVDPAGLGEVRAHIAALLQIAPVLILTADPAGHDDGTVPIVGKYAEGPALVDAIQAAAARVQVTTTARPRRDTDPDVRLSAREEQVLGQVSHGLTHSQIGTRLGLSRHTVDTYVKRIRVKLQIGNKAELTRVAMLRRLAAHDLVDERSA